MSYHGDEYYEDLEYQYMMEEMEQEAFLADMKATEDSILESRWKSFSNERLAASAYQPTQLISMLSEHISKSSGMFGNVMNIKGVFKYGNGKFYGTYFYDVLQDETNSAFITILVPQLLRQKLIPNSLVILRGMAAKRISNNGHVELQFRVDAIVEEVKQKAYNEDDQKRIEIVRKKATKGKKNVTLLLKKKILESEKPKVCLVYAQSSITDKDFEKGVRNAVAFIDFVEDRSTSFGNPDAVRNRLLQLDNANYDAIAIVRGGGSGIEQVDHPKILETILNMNTPTINGAGHVDDKLWIHSVVDENPSTPSLLGTYFDNLVNEAVAQKEGTLAHLRKEIERQFKPSLDRLKNLETESKEAKEKIKTLEKENKTLSNQFQDNVFEVSDLKSSVTKWRYIAAFLFIAFVFSMIYIFSHS